MTRRSTDVSRTFKDCRSVRQAETAQAIEDRKVLGRLELDAILAGIDMADCADKSASQWHRVRRTIRQVLQLEEEAKEARR